MTTKEKLYTKPKIKSSKITTISLYGKDSLESSADIEYLLAANNSKP